MDDVTALTTSRMAVGVLLSKTRRDATPSCRTPSGDFEASIKSIKQTLHKPPLGESNPVILKITASQPCLSSPNHYQEAVTQLQLFPPYDVWSEGLLLAQQFSSVRQRNFNIACIRRTTTGMFMAAPSRRLPNITDGTCLTSFAKPVTKRPDCEPRLSTQVTLLRLQIQIALASLRLPITKLQVATALPTKLPLVYYTLKRSFSNCK